MKKVAFVTTFAAVAFAAYPAAACDPEEQAVAAATDQAPQASPACSGVNCSAPLPTSVVTDAVRRPAVAPVPIVLSSSEPPAASVPIVLSSKRGPRAASVPIVLSSTRGPLAATSVPIVLSSNRGPAGDGFTFKHAFHANLAPMPFKVSNMTIDEPE